MLLVTTPTIEGKRTVQVLGLVQGNTVRARNIGRDFLAGLRNVVGGEVGQYSRLLTEAREQAVSRMVQQAEALGANAVVNLRFSTSMIMSATAEILVYGTAVVVED
ncbi:MAG: YbjQ family protein [Chloroflexi bacterium]|nr:YbjQ family protein [Chloroflexota bacterium]